MSGPCGYRKWCALGREALEFSSRTRMSDVCADVFARACRPRRVCKLCSDSSAFPHRSSSVSLRCFRRFQLWCHTQPRKVQHYYAPQALDDVLSKHKVWRAGRVEAAIRRKTIAHYRSKRSNTADGSEKDGRQPKRIVANREEEGEDGAQ